MSEGREPQGQAPLSRTTAERLRPGGQGTAGGEEAGAASADPGATIRGRRYRALLDFAALIGALA